MTEDEPLWTYADLSRYTKIPTASLRMLVMRDLIPHMRVGPRTVRFMPAAVRAWLIARTEGNGAERRLPRGKAALAETEQPAR